MFYDEDLVIDLRLNILNKYVHKFVIVESKFTHSGKKRELLFDIKKYSKFKKIALIGASKDLKKTSSIVMKCLQDYGVKVYPVNPSMKGEKILGEEVFGKISEIKDKVEIIDPDSIFSSKVLFENDISLGDLCIILFKSKVKTFS